MVKRSFLTLGKTGRWPGPSMLRLSLILSFLIFASTAQASSSPQQDKIVLNGKNLTIDQVILVARKNIHVEADGTAMELVNQAYRLLLEAGNQGIPIYGLNRGVGLNKDKTIFTGPILDEHGNILPEVRRLSEQFNRDDLLATSAGVGPLLPEEVVRAAMLIRLNTMLTGRTGAQKEVAEMYVQFLNKRISPLVPSRSSVGEADITILAHVGLAMIGEGEVTLDGKRMQASEALKKVSLTPVKTVAKDALAIFSSNAYSAALACLAVVEAEHLLQISSKVFALSLEGLNGNVAAFLPYVHEIRPFRSQGKAAEQIRADLQGSYLWQVSDQRALQDPLSYRTASYIFGAAGETLEKLKALLQIQINSSDDNPAVIIGISPSEDSPSQVATYFVTQGKIRGAVIPTANFEPFPWVLELESLGIALSHVSRASAQRTLRLATPEFTNLSRFLTPDDKTIAYGAIQKASISLDAENRELSNPVSADFFPVAGDIEDVATEAARAAARIIRMIDNLYYLHGIELMHAAQAIDLRQRRLSLGIGTRALYDAYRAEVTFLDRDRVLTNDIRKSHDFLKKFANSE